MTLHFKNVITVWEQVGLETQKALTEVFSGMKQEDSLTHFIPKYVTYRLGS